MKKKFETFFFWKKSNIIKKKKIYPHTNNLENNIFEDIFNYNFYIEDSYILIENYFL